LEHGIVTVGRSAIEIMGMKSHSGHSGGSLHWKWRLAHAVATGQIAETDGMMALR
jgi:hypothetical protein